MRLELLLLFTIAFPIIVQSVSTSTRDATLVDSYVATSGTNVLIRDHHPSDSVYPSDAGNTFSCNTPSNIRIVQAEFMLKKSGSPTGTAYAVLYSSTGLLARSGGFDVSTLTTSFDLYTFSFDASEQYEMTAGTVYAIVFEGPSSGTIDTSNYVAVKMDGTSTSHNGNLIYYANEAWTGTRTYDLTFYVYGAYDPSNDAPGSHGHVPDGFELYYATSFEDAVVVDRNHLNLDIAHRFNPGWPDPGESGSRMWIDDSFARSGSRCLGLELNNIGQGNMRAEFNIIGAQIQLGEEFYVSEWIFLPPDWMLHSPTQRWYALANIWTEQNPPYWAPKVGIQISQTEFNVPDFNIYLFGRYADNTKWGDCWTPNYPLTRGGWFRLEIHAKHGEFARVWINGELLGDTTEVPEKAVNDFAITLVKTYLANDDTTNHRIWMDDLELWRPIR